MKIYNTLTRKIELIEPINPPNISLYSCGPTVYDFVQIGNMRTYCNVDFLKRILLYSKYNVKHVMNITDVGHLSGDDDTGEDKMEKGAKKFNKTVWEVAKFYTDFFFKSSDALNIIRPDIVSKATEHIEDMIKLITQLKIKGYVYETKEALYFDVLKFSNYGKLSGQKLEEKIQAVREEVNVDLEKKHPADFALWFKRVGRFANHTMFWSSPWGDGFPGWHIECSAMSMKYLGETIDIHTGGIDHIAVHHENEIAQSEAITNKQFVKYWVHYNFLTVDDQKMSKSLGNFYTIDDVIKNNIDPIALRLLFLQSHYRQSLNFTWKSAQASQEALNRLRDITINLKVKEPLTVQFSAKAKIFQDQFDQAIKNDLQTPQAIAVMWEMLKSDITNDEKYALLIDFDKVFGLKLSEHKEEKTPDEMEVLAKERYQARKTGDYKKADEIRLIMASKGYGTLDSKDGYKIKKI